MPRFEVFIRSAVSSQDIEADCALSAKESFLEMIKDNIGIKDLEANELED